MTYQFLLFDLDHTLWDFDLAETQALTQLFTQHGINHAEIPQYMSTYKQINTALWQQVERNEISRQQLANTRFAQLFTLFGQAVDGTLLAANYQTLLGQQGQVIQGAVELLAALKPHYKLYAATNGITAIQQQRLAHSDITPYFDDIFISEALGVSKPDPRFFEYIAQHIPNFSKQTALMIGDNPLADIHGAMQYGLDAVWFNPTQQPYPQAGAPTYTIHTLEALLPLLQAHRKD